MATASGCSAASVLLLDRSLGHSVLIRVAPGMKEPWCTSKAVCCTAIPDTTAAEKPVPQQMQTGIYDTLRCGGASPAIVIGDGSHFTFTLCMLKGSMFTS